VPVVPSTPEMPIALKVEFAANRKIRERNKFWYRVAHWPIWIWVFFLAPGPLTFDLFAHGGSLNNWYWLLVVLAGTGLAGLYAQLPGVEARPYILFFSEDKPNPLYRRVCYTFAWNALLNFVLLNLAGSLDAVITGRWRMKEIYTKYYFILLAVIVLLGVLGLLPRVGRSTKGEGIERRYFYGAVWSIALSQTLMLILWKALPKNHLTDIVKLCAFVISLAGFGALSVLGLLPRTRPILPGEAMVAD
jgi:hypothetical protein